MARKRKKKVTVETGAGESAELEIDEIEELIEDEPEEDIIEPVIEQAAAKIGGIAARLRRHFKIYSDQGIALTGVRLGPDHRKELDGATELDGITIIEDPRDGFIKFEF